MIKSMKGTYKYGKCTFKEENLFKFKRFTDSEARILEFVPQYKNFNAMERNELGYAKRSSRKENKVALDTLGALIVEDIYTGRTFTIGMGFDAKTKKDIWTNRFKYKGAIITYKFFDKGNYEKARHGVYKGFRSKLDLSI
jgi:hypothetical protein